MLTDEQKKLDREQDKLAKEALLKKGIRITQVNHDYGNLVKFTEMVHKIPTNIPYEMIGMAPVKIVSKEDLMKEYPPNE